MMIRLIVITAMAATAIPVANGQYIEIDGIKGESGKTGCATADGKVTIPATPAKAGVRVAVGDLNGDGRQARAKKVDSFAIKQKASASQTGTGKLKPVEKGSKAITDPGCVP